MDTILVPLDGSKLAEHVLPYARTLASALNARLHLLRVLSSVDNTSVAPQPTSSIDDEHIGQTSQRHPYDYLEAHTAILRDEHVTVTTEIRVGPPADVIVEVAAMKQARLIAMATHGYSGIRRWTLGSVTDKVLHATNAPMLIVRGSYQTPIQTPAFKRIMVPLDGSELARQALPIATELALATQAEVELFEAINPPFAPYANMHSPRAPTVAYDEVIEALRNVSAHNLEMIAKSITCQGIPVTTTVTVNYPAESIVDEAERRGTDLIVMATHGYSGLRRWALGSIADKVLHVTTTPLLLVRVQSDN
jgi:nucleotide-binding universal stress UspA family protein